jgi:DNA repair protein RadC
MDQPEDSEAFDPRLNTASPGAAEAPPDRVPAEEEFRPAPAADKPDVLEWNGPVRVLADYLGAAGITRPASCARSLLEEFGSLSDMFAAPRWRLRRVAGRRVANILAAGCSLMKARFLEQVREGPLVQRSRELIDLLQLELGFLKHERLLALYVDSNARLMRIETVGDGPVGEVPIDNRRIVGCGLAIGASGFILVHNHPSGIPQPSKADLAVTSRLRALGRELDLHLLDHLIVARGRLASIEDCWREARWEARRE